MLPLHTARTYKETMQRAAQYQYTRRARGPLPPINRPHQSHSATLSIALMSQNILRLELSGGGILSWWSSLLFGPPQLQSALWYSKNSALGVRVISRVMEVGKWWTHVSLRVVMISHFRLMERNTAPAAQETSTLLSISSPSSPWYTLKLVWRSKPIRWWRHLEWRHSSFWFVLLQFYFFLRQKVIKITETWMSGG